MFNFRFVFSLILVFNNLYFINMIIKDEKKKFGIEII